MRAVLLVLPIACFAACALIAGLPDYEDRREAGDGSVLDALDPDGAIVPPDAARPDAEHLGCNGSPPPIAYYRLDEGTGTTINDCSPAAHNGTLSGAATWTTGRVGPSALRFDGGIVDLGAPPSFDITGAMTIAAWVKVDSFATSGRILVRSGGPMDRGWQLNVEPNGTASFQIAVDAMVTAEASKSIPAGTWVHLAGVFEPGVTLSLYVDGALGNSAVPAPASQRTSTQPAAMGRRPDGCCDLAGTIDDVRLYGRALSAADIAILAAQ